MIRRLAPTAVALVGELAVVIACLSFDLRLALGALGVILIVEAREAA